MAYGDGREGEVQSADHAEGEIHGVAGCGDELGENGSGSGSGVLRETCFRCAYDHERWAVLEEATAMKRVGVGLGHSASRGRAEGIRRGCFHFPEEELHIASCHRQGTANGTLVGSSSKCCHRVVSACASAAASDAGGAGVRVARALSAHAHASSEYLYAAGVPCASDAHAADAGVASVAGPDRGGGEKERPAEDVKGGSTVHEEEAETSADLVEGGEAAGRGERARDGENLWVDNPWSESRGSLTTQGRVPVTMVFPTVVTPCHSASVRLFQPPVGDGYHQQIRYHCQPWLHLRSGLL